jgi:5-methylcytosine-specific restriction protein A
LGADAVAIARPVHQPIGGQTWQDRKAACAAGRVSPSRTYGRRWQELRRVYLATHPTCECDDRCGGVAAVVDHREPHNGNDRLMYAWDNLRSMTKACHDRKTASYDGGFGNPIKRGSR